MNMCPWNAEEPNSAIKQDGGIQDDELGVWGDWTDSVPRNWSEVHSCLQVREGGGGEEQEASKQGWRNLAKLERVKCGLDRIITKRDASTNR
jgi:hypothetical protein